MIPAPKHRKAFDTRSRDQWDDRAVCFAGSADKKAALAAGVPARRLGTPEDIGAMIVFLASDKADFVTGQIIGVNGGKTAL